MNEATPNMGTRQKQYLRYLICACQDNVINGNEYFFVGGFSYEEAAQKLAEYLAANRLSAKYRFANMNID